MKMTAQEYARRVQRAGPHSPLLPDCLWAFGVGGGICLLGEILRQSYLVNGLVSAAIEFKAEGRVLGTGAKMFTIAGPVIVYGTLAAVVYGAVLWAVQTLPLYL